MRGFNPNPERSLLSASETRLSESQEALYPLIVPENEKKAMEMEGFRDLYKDGVDHDLEEVRILQEKFAENDVREGVVESSRKAGKFFEAVVNYGIDKVGFLGPDATAIVPSKYDDYIRKIDTIVEFENEDSTSHLAMGMDVTRNREDIRKKFKDIRTSIDKGTLSSAKYFQSTNFRGELRNIVRVVVGADQPAIDSVSDLILGRMRLQKSIKEAEGKPEFSKALQEEYSRKSAALGEHPLQWIILDEIRQQLGAFQTYADRKNRPEASAQCARMLNLIDKVIEEKSNGEPIDDAIFENDRVYRLIQDEVRSF